MGKNSATYTMVLQDPRTMVSLPQKSEIHKLRISQISYTTASANQKFILVQIGNTADKMYFTNGTYIKYTFAFYLQPTADTFAFYINNQENFFDVISDTPIDMGNFEINLMIDGEHNQDISPSNPLTIELYME